jgi:hypothetical protein
MINISEIVASKGYKNFMKYVYGWGASVVLIGALFKILHLPGSSIMLGVGLTVEALIFFFSGFEPLHEELDWTLVYPELAGLTDDFDEDDAQVRRFDRAHETPQVVGMPLSAGVIAGAGVAAAAAVSAPSAGVSTGGTVIVGGGSPSALAKFDELLEKAEISPELFKKLGDGLTSLNNTAAQLADLGEAGAASKEFVTKLKGASESVGQFSSTYQQSTDTLKESVVNLSDSYAKSAQAFNQTNSQLVTAYSSFADKLTNEINTIGAEGGQYADKLGSLNKNLAALNSVYELQIRNYNSHIESSNEYFKGMDNMVESIQQTVGHAQNLNKGVQQLEQNVSSLNSIYGNMLSSLNFSK